jgi:DNA invertase Pin-like site-specific DNA recombinase
MPRPRLKAAAQGGPAATLFIAYLRVSTDQQGRSGLGLEAQRATVAGFVAGQQGRLIAEFVEVESGRKKDRPQLAAALAACRTQRAALVVAKLDRLARNVAFVSGLMEAGVEFRVADMPTVTRLTLHILAAVAEEEARMISARTKAALAAAKARGVKLGNPRMRKGQDFRGSSLGRRAQSARSVARAADLLPSVREAQAAGNVSLRQIAAHLTAKGIRSPGGGEVWGAQQVRRVILAARDVAP